MSLLLIKITLLEIEPRIWRRFLVTSSITLASFHHVLQAVMGWEDCHMHDFVIGDEHYGWEDEDGALPWEVHDEERYKLGDLVEKGDTLTYTYDFGDDWQHELVVEQVLKRPKGTTVKIALCVDGARACPPEDCGGPGGYEELLEVLADPGHEEHESMREWAGDWDPELFDIDQANAELAPA